MLSAGIEIISVAEIKPTEPSELNEAFHGI
jgi:hypothetical protein